MSFLYGIKKLFILDETSVAISFSFLERLQLLLVKLKGKNDRVYPSYERFELGLLTLYTPYK